MKKYVWATTAVALVAIAGPAASASAHLTDSVGQPSNPSKVVPAASDPAPTRATEVTKVVRAPAPLPKVTVVSGDTLSGIGARTHRTWEQLASYNHIANPNLIYVGNVVVIPPVTYEAGPVVLPSTPSYTPPVSHTVHATYYSAPVVRYTPRPAPVVSAPVNSGGVWGCIAAHESGGNPGENTGNGYEGAFQFAPSTWASMGTGYAHAYDAPYSVQLGAAERLQQEAGWGQWPNTSRMCGV